MLIRYVVVLILLIRGSMMAGAKDGIEYFVTITDYEKLYDWEVSFCIIFQ